MKKILLLLIQTSLFAALPNEGLLKYQKKYSMCKGTTDFSIANCLLNGNLNYNRFRGDRQAYRKIKLTVMHTALKDGDIYQNIMSLLPTTKRYIALKAYIDYLYSIESNYLTPQFKGDEAEDILHIKRVFNLLQDVTLDESKGITPEFESSLLTFQKQHGLKEDGKIGPRTKRVLQMSISKIISKVKKNLTLESISMPKGSQYVLVNIPEFKMYYYEEYNEVLNMRIVVGKRKMRTPIFNRNMKYIVKNPRWNVPSRIYAKEYAHKSEEYLRKNRFAYNLEGKLYQKSGRGNALGIVKFLFPNKFNVYMHDTPSKSLFNRTVRAYSHGCIRLQKPLDLLNALGYQYENKRNKWVTLKNKVPVYIEYHTVWIDDEGIAQFRNDIYGYEKKLFH